MVTLKQILFVDDEPNILEGIHRMLHSMRNQWDMTFVESGKEALDMLARKHFDIVLSDMQMPGIDGAELLGIVRERYPHMIRIILSGHSDEEMIMRSVKSTHQFLVKPCDAHTLKATLERAFIIQDLLNNKKLRKIVSGIKKLPSLPRLYNLIMDETNSPDPTLKRVSDIIAQDMAMTARILQVVNSAFFGLSQEITGIQQATTYLGLETLRLLVISVHLFSNFKEDQAIYGFSIEDLWKHSLMVGSLAKDIATAQLADKNTIQDAMMAGILHDIGKLILLNAPTESRLVNDLVKEKGCSHLHAENEIMGTSHAEVGAYLLGIWGIPHKVVESVGFHHKPSKICGNNFTALTAVHIANAMLKQEEDPTGSVNYNYIDLDYIRFLDLEDRLPGWAELCDIAKKKESFLEK